MTKDIRVPVFLRFQHRLERVTELKKLFYRLTVQLVYHKRYHQDKQVEELWVGLAVVRTLTSASI